MATVRRTPVSEILLAMSAAVRAATGLGDGAVMISAKRLIRYQANREIHIQPRSPVKDGLVSDGSGRTAQLIRRRVDVVIGCRNALDFVNDGTSALTSTDAELGLFTTEELVLDALADILLEDSSENALLWEPVKFMGGGETPAQDPSEDEMSLGMNQSVLVFEIAYMAALTQSTIC